MPVKAEVLEQLGESALILPDLINRGLAANDRIKYLLTLLQSARDHAEHPGRLAPSLHAEREASGVDDASFDAVIAGSVRDADLGLSIPQASHLHTLIVDDIRRMLEPLEAASTSEAGEPGLYQTLSQRFDRLLGSLPSPEADRVTPAYVDALTRVTRNEGDGVHMLLMDLHRELNRLQTSIASESVDGAHVYGMLTQTGRSWPPSWPASTQLRP